MRESIENQRMLELAAAVSRQEHAEKQVEHWRTQLGISEERLRHLYRQKSVPTQAVRREHMYRRGLHERLVDAQEALEAAVREVADARTALLEATKERKVMERLRERHEAEYRRAQDRREQADLDEVASRASGQEQVALAPSGREEAFLA